MRRTMRHQPLQCKITLDEKQSNLQNACLILRENFDIAIFLRVNIFQYTRIAG